MNATDKHCNEGAESNIAWFSRDWGYALVDSHKGKAIVWDATRQWLGMAPAQLVRVALTKAPEEVAACDALREGLK